MDLYLKVCYDCSRLITHQYSTSFSLGIRMFSKELHGVCHIWIEDLHNEIVDTFHNKDKNKLLADFRNDTFKVISQK